MGQDIFGDSIDHVIAWIKGRQEHDLIQAFSTECLQLLNQLILGADKAAGGNGFGGDKPFFFGDHPTVVTGVNALMASISWEGFM